MSIDNRIALVKDLIRKREEIDQQLAELFGGGTLKKQKCSICGSTEHTARTCPQKPGATTKPQTSNSLPSSPFEALSRYRTNDEESAQV